MREIKGKRILKSSENPRPLNILIIPDKFKGTLSSRAAAIAIATGWHRVRPHDRLTLLPMSDGGDDFGEVMSGFAGARPQKVKTVDAAHRPVVAAWWWQKETRTAIIESARVIGLAMLPLGKFHPFQLDSFGLGAIFGAAARKGAKRFIVGIGGSATNDAGFGMAKAMGWKFLDASGSFIEGWTQLDRLESIQQPEKDLAFEEVLVAVDVKNPLNGQRGATRVYGPQKGLVPANFKTAENALRRLAEVWKKQFHHDSQNVPGAGAAGGLGFGLVAFMGAKLTPGFELFAQYAGLDRMIYSSDLVITGEGAVDESTLMGKGVGQLADACVKRNVPCIALAGLLSRSPRIRRTFAHAYSLTENASPEEAKKRAGPLLAHLSARAAGDWTASVKKRRGSP